MSVFPTINSYEGIGCEENDNTDVVTSYTFEMRDRPGPKIIVKADTMLAFRSAIDRILEINGHAPAATSPVANLASRLQGCGHDRVTVKVKTNEAQPDKFDFEVLPN